MKLPEVAKHFLWRQPRVEPRVPGEITHMSAHQERRSSYAVPRDRRVAACWLEEGRQHSKGRRLSGAVRTKQSHHFTAFHLEINGLYRI